MDSYINPATGFREEVSQWTWLFAFLFGPLYFIYKGIWRHVLIQVVLVVFFYAAFGAPGTMFVFLMNVVYAFAAKGIVANQLQRQGYKPASGPEPSPGYRPDGLTHVHPRPTPAPPTALPARAVRNCPFCAEEILAAARKCKHCGSEVEPLYSQDQSIL
jgi:hypothetical protein